MANPFAAAKAVDKPAKRITFSNSTDRRQVDLVVSLGSKVTEESSSWDMKSWQQMCGGAAANNCCRVNWVDNIDYQALWESIRDGYRNVEDGQDGFLTAVGAMRAFGIVPADDASWTVNFGTEGREVKLGKEYVVRAVETMRRQHGDTQISWTKAVVAVLRARMRSVWHGSAVGRFVLATASEVSRAISS